MTIYIAMNAYDGEIKAACSTREKAERAKDLLLADYVEAVEVDEFCERPEFAGNKVPYSVRMGEGGDLVSVSRTGLATLDYHNWEPWGDNETAVIHVLADCADSAIKEAEDVRQGLIGAGEWTMDWEEWRDL